MSQLPEGTGWFSPRTVVAIGVPNMLLLILVLSMLGIIPTPFFDSLPLVRQVYADNASVMPIFQEILRLEILKCERDSKTKEDITFCYPSQRLLQRITQNNEQSSSSATLAP